MTSYVIQDWQSAVDVPLTKTVPCSLLSDADKKLRMLGMPTSGPAQVLPPMRTNVYYPTEIELEKYRKRGVVEPIAKVVEISNGNGEVIKAAVDTNGEVVDVEKVQNFAGVAIAAAILFAVLGG